MASQIDPSARKPPTSPPKRSGRRVPTKQQLIEQDERKAYATLRTLYLEENQQCTRPGCVRTAMFIHHICSGTAGKAASRLNTNTWLEYCDERCHEAIERLPWEMQKMLKALRVQETIDRLRT